MVSRREPFEAGLRGWLAIGARQVERSGVEVLNAGEFVDEEEPVASGVVGVAEGVFGLEGFAVVSQVEPEGVGEGGAFGGSGDIGLLPAEDGFGEREEGREFSDGSAGAVLGEEVEEGAVSGEEVLVDVRAGFEEGGDGDDEAFRLDVAEPLFVRELFRGFGHGVSWSPATDIRAQLVPCGGLSLRKARGCARARSPAHSAILRDAYSSNGGHALHLTAFVIMVGQQQLQVFVVVAHAGNEVFLLKIQDVAHSP